MFKQIDNYILEERIGAGCYGEVYKAHNNTNGEVVAVKAMERDLVTGNFLELLENEVKILQTCQNENLIRLFDVKKTESNVYMVYEYCNGGDLGIYLQQRGHLKEKEAVCYFLQILNGFKTLVRNKVMHRDLKLSNILKHDKNIKISDFGFSKILDNLDLTKTMIGSPLTMAPEILEGGSYSNKADIWSVGVVFYEMLFGRPPFLGFNIIDLRKEIKTCKLEIPRDINNISAEAEDVLVKMLKVDPKQRIEWTDLFEHRINERLKDEMKKKMDSMLNQHNFRKIFCYNSLYLWPDLVPKILQEGDGRLVQQNYINHLEQMASTNTEISDVCSTKATENNDAHDD